MGLRRGALPEASLEVRQPATRGWTCKLSHDNVALAPAVRQCHVGRGARRFGSGASAARATVALL